MPKEVDHVERRGELADAVLRVVARGGVRAVTMRTVASEAGWSTGALNHYFDGKDDLLVAALRRAMHLIRREIAAAAASSDYKAALERMLVQVLPVDDTPSRLRPCLAFILWRGSCGRRDPRHTWQPPTLRGDAKLAEIVRRGQDAGNFVTSLEPEWVADCLGALVDGLSTRSVIQDIGPEPQLFRDAVHSWVAVFTTSSPSEVTERRGLMKKRLVREASARTARFLAAFLHRTRRSSRKRSLTDGPLRARISTNRYALCHASRGSDQQEGEVPEWETPQWPRRTRKATGESTVDSS